MKRNITGIRKDTFLIYPRFLQIILNAQYPDLERGGNTMDLKPMGLNCFRALALKKKTVGQFQGKIPLEKFGQLPETEDIVNVEEPEPEFQNLDSDDEGVLISYDGDDELPPEAEVDTTQLVIPPVITAENLALLLKSVNEKIGNPRPTSVLQNLKP
ncbi:hypothetical protein Hanom_Chr16g01469851 [Helianthus anomalus]